MKILNHHNSPYTYLIGWSKIEKFYYGVRFAKNCHPSDLFTKYFTSSKHVHKIIEELGEPDIIMVIKTFSSTEAARLHENKVLRRLDVLSNSKFINKSTNISIDTICCSSATKGKTYEEIYGVEKANQLKIERSKSGKGRKLTDEQKKKISESRIKNEIKQTEEWKKGQSQRSKELWKSIEYRILMSQKKGSHITLISKCPVCGSYMKAERKYCSHSCSNLGRLQERFDFS